ELDCPQRSPEGGRGAGQPDGERRAIDARPNPRSRRRVGGRNGAVAESAIRVAVVHPGWQDGRPERGSHPGELDQGNKVGRGNAVRLEEIRRQPRRRRTVLRSGYLARRRYCAMRTLTVSVTVVRPQPQRSVL